MGRLLGRELRLGVGVGRRLSAGRGRRGTVVDVGLRVREGLLVGMHLKAVVAWRRPCWGRGVEVGLRACGLFGVSHGEERSGGVVVQCCQSNA